MAIFQIDCPKCHTTNKSGSKYCGNCGERLPGSEMKCSSCGAVVAADRIFCGNCGKPLAESAAATLTGNRWARRATDFATKVEVDDVDGFFKKGLIVEAGTQAIFFVNGAVSGILDPGRYDMGGLLQKIKNVFSSKTTTAVLVDTGDVELQFSFADLLTRDPVRLSAEARMVAQLDNPALFFENMMKGRQNYALAELKGFLEGELRNCMQEFVRTRSLLELSSDTAFKKQIEQAVSRHLAGTFDRKGLSFISVRIFDFRHPRMDELTGKREEYWLHAQDLEARLAGGATAGLERRLLDQETAKSVMEVEVFEERAKVFERMRRAVASDRMNKVRSEDDFEKFMTDIDGGKLLRKDEYETLQREFSEKQEDHDQLRRHLIQRLKLEQQSELQKVELAGKLAAQHTITDAARDEEMAQLDHRLASARKEMEMRQAQEWNQVKQQADARRLQVETEIDLARQKKKTEIELEEIEDQADMRSAAAALDLLKRQKEIRKEESDWEVERKVRERASMSDITIKEESQRHQQELAKIQVLSSLSPETLIAAAPADRAAMLAELRRTEALRGFSEEQILAMAAEKSSAVAQAFQEKFRNASAADIQRAYDRMLEMKDRGITDQKEMSRQYAQMMQEMYNKGMETQRDTATAATRATQPGMTVITPGMGAGGVVQTGVPGLGGRLVVCPNCHAEMREGNKFCENCGHKFFD